MTQFVGLHELAELLGVSRQRADQLVRQTGFPKPAAELKAGRIWKQVEVERWIAKHRPSPSEGGVGPR
jgi:predicted DNA-binding transcriptional regulator AlpA